MPSRHLLDPELASILEAVPGGALTAEMLAAQGPAMTEMGRAAVLPPPDGVATTEQMIPGLNRAPDIRVLIHQPAQSGTGRPGILHIHGGGYVIGSPEMGSPVNAQYVLEMGAVVVSVDLIADAVADALADDAADDAADGVAYGAVNVGDCANG